MTRTHPSWPDILDGAEFRWLFHGTPLPDGWAFADSGRVETHHHHHALLIYRTFHKKHSRSSGSPSELRRVRAGGER